MAAALALAALVALIAFAFFLMWGMSRIFRGHHNDGESLGGPTTYAGHDNIAHSEGGRRRWSKMQGALNQISLPGVDATAPVKDAEKLEFDVTRCSYAEFFKALNEPELGALLMCATDFDIAATSDRVNSL